MLKKESLNTTKQGNYRIKNHVEEQKKLTIVGSKERFILSTSLMTHVFQHDCTWDLRWFLFYGFLDYIVDNTCY